MTRGRGIIVLGVEVLAGGDCRVDVGMSSRDDTGVRYDAGAGVIVLGVESWV